LRIIIDADACPKGVKLICGELAKKYRLELIMVVDSAHELRGDFKVIQVEKGDDSVDLEILKISTKEDIVITQDYGLATIILEKTHSVIHPNGFIYNKFNIDSLMFSRHMSAKIRANGGRTKGPKKRKANNDVQFRETLLNILQNL
jgi:uncharacterized protein YaiI (UPF0178 family)